jgi:hypothetical protein
VTFFFLDNFVFYNLFVLCNGFLKIRAGSGNYFGFEAFYLNIVSPKDLSILHLSTMNFHFDALSISLAYLLVSNSFVVDIFTGKFVILFFLCEVDTL